MALDTSEPSSAGPPQPGAQNTGYQSELGLEQYCNSKIMSDITIRYGANGEKVFYGHKLVLCSEIRWFKSGFRGGFKESNDKEVTLRDDDPDALYKLLNFPYARKWYKTDDSWKHSCTPHTHESWYAELLSIIEQFGVADKYDCPAYVDWLSHRFDKFIKQYLNLLAKLDKPEEQAENVSKIISRVYDLAAGRPAFRTQDTICAYRLRGLRLGAT